MDDVAYLRQHAVVEEYLAFVDSSKRDKSAWRTPSQYQVSWNTPFRHVFGLDIVDIALPHSAYTITTDYNTLRFRFHAPGYKDDPSYQPPPWITVAVRPGNHTPDTLIAELKAKMIEPISTVVALPRRIDVKPASEPFALVSKIVFFSEAPFDIDTQSPLAPVLGFSELLDATRSQQVATFTDVQSLDISSGETTMLAGSTSTDNGFSLTRGRRMKQRFSAAKSSNISRLEVFIVPFGRTSHLDGLVDFTVTNARTGRQVVAGKIRVLYPSMSVADMSEAVQASVGSDMLLATESYWLSVSDDNNTDPNNCYRIAYGPGTGPAGTLRVVEDGTEDAWYDPHDMMTVQLRAVPYQYLMAPPGILNLASPVAYLTLRCPEIERHMYGSRAYEAWNMGIATVKTANEGYQQRYMSTIAPKRDFHPIARLQRLTFRWETPDGKLHNFLGVDHNITFLIRYYTIPQKTQAAYTLNPSFNPDFLAWKNQHELADGDSDGEDPVPPYPAAQRCAGYY